VVNVSSEFYYGTKILNHLNPDYYLGAFFESVITKFTHLPLGVMVGIIVGCVVFFIIVYGLNRWKFPEAENIRLLSLLASFWTWTLSILFLRFLVFVHDPAVKWLFFVASAAIAVQTAGSFISITIIVWRYELKQNKEFGKFVECHRVTTAIFWLCSVVSTNNFLLVTSKIFNLNAPLSKRATYWIQICEIFQWVGSVCAIITQIQICVYLDDFQTVAALCLICSAISILIKLFSLWIVMMLFCRQEEQPEATELASLS